MIIEIGSELLPLLLGEPGTSKSTFVNVMVLILDPNYFETECGNGNIYDMETNTDDKHALVSGSNSLITILREVPKRTVVILNKFYKMASVKSV